MTLETEHGERSNAQLGRSLVNWGVMTPEWEPAFAALPRSLFLPEVFWAHDMATGQSITANQRTDPDRWQYWAATDAPIVTQWDDGNHKGAGPGTVPTSSASMPSVVLAMLRDLDVQPGHRVLELGTGTGWNAALLAHRLGDANVVTIEVDRAVAETARARLAAAGLKPTVVAGDAAGGYPLGVPFDRTVATFGIRQLPYEWVRQARPGGLILAPWGTHFGNGDALVKLTVHEDGSASGPFLRPVEFMKMRSQRLIWPEAPATGGELAESTTMTTLPAFGLFEPFPFAMGVRVPDVTHAIQYHDGGHTLWLYSLAEPAWAATTFRNGKTEHQVRQYGGRRLWDEFEAAVAWWFEMGEPGFGRFGLTVARDGQHVWLDEPGNLVR